jgi:hypothetical protein
MKPDDFKPDAIAPFSEAPCSACCGVPMNISGKPGEYVLDCPQCLRPCEPQSQSEWNRWRLRNICKVAGYTNVHF